MSALRGFGITDTTAVLSELGRWPNSRHALKSEVISTGEIPKAHLMRRHVMLDLPGAEVFEVPLRASRISSGVMGEIDERVKEEDH